jgi:methyl-accepting chemotaxis protein
MKSIKTKLIVSFSILIFSVTLIIGFISIQSGYRSLKKEAEKSLKSLAEEEAKLTQSRMETLITSLQIIAQKKEIENMGWEVNPDTLKEELKKTNFLDIGYVLPNGYSYYTDGTVRLMSDRSYIKDALKGKASMSDVIISRVTRKPEIEISVPVKKDGQTVGAVVARKEADTLGVIIKDGGYGKNGYAFIINGSGRVIAYPDTSKVIGMFNPIEAAKKDPKFISTAKAYQSMRMTKSGVTGFHEGGADYIAGFAPIEGTDWIFAITADRGEVLSVIPGMIRTMLAASFLVLLFSLGLVFLLDLTITRPLIGITRLSRQIADLNLKENISDVYLRQKDEIGILSGAFQALMVKLREIIMQMNESVNQVTDAAYELSAASQQSSSVTDEISCTVEHIAEGAMEQAGSTQVGQANALKLGEMIEKNHEHAVKINRTTEQVNNLVKGGLSNIDRLSLSTLENRKATEEIGSIIMQTKKSSEQISEASRMISDMARQTNLLALNASIEAARAGEAGRGFSVVADEIQKMADQSAISTKYIDDIIATLLKNVNKSFESMEQIRQTEERQQNNVAETIQKYQAIAKAMKISEDAVTELNTSQKDMLTSKKEILDLLMSLSAIAEQNAEGARQAASFVEEQTISARTLADTSMKLSNLAGSLQLIIDKVHI